MTGMRGYIGDHVPTEQMFRLAVEACPSGMVIIDAVGEIVMVNGEIERQFGYTRQEMLGQPVDMLVPERLRGQHARHRHHFMPKPEARHMGGARDLFGQRKDGTEFPVEVGLNPISSGDQLLVLGVVVDISERKQMERLKDEFVATVSHELRTPMTSISGSLGLLMNQPPGQLPDSAMRLLAIAHKNSQRLVRLINDILDMEKIESGRAVFNFVRVDLCHVAKQAIEDIRGFAEGYGVAMLLDAAPATAYVSADPDRLVQVITNLLSNAVKISPPGGEVSVALEAKGDAFRISVRDHGSGIPEEFRPQVFDKFAQADGTDSRQKGGTGLGLSIVKQIVERLGGKVRFDDAPGGGTIFSVDLPFWDGAASIEIDAAAEGTPPRILLCDDDPAVAKVVRMHLRRAGFTVDFAHTLETAVALANTNRYSAIIVDLKMRGCDGIDLILRLRAQPQHGNTPIVIISGDIESGRDDLRSARLNVLDWFQKPIDFRRLTEVLVVATSPETRARRLRVLHVEDDSDILAAVARELQSIAEVISADSAESALRVIATTHIDLVVLDIVLGQDSGLNLLPDLHDRSGNAIPVIIFSCGVADMEMQMKFGGQIDSSFSKMNSPLEGLGIAVRDRLALMPQNRAKELA